MYDTSVLGSVTPGSGGRDRLRSSRALSEKRFSARLKLAEVKIA